MSEYKRLTEKSIGCFEYRLKDHKPVVGEFSTYEAFYDYSMAVRQLGKYEDIGSPEELAELAKAKAVGRLVEVVRCKDCVNVEISRETNRLFCGFKRVKRDDFCSLGKSKEEAEQGQKIGGGQ